MPGEHRRRRRQLEPCRAVSIFVRCRLGDDELKVAFMVALELSGRCERAADEDARTPAQRIRAAGASRPIKLSPAEQAALPRATAWEAEAETVARTERQPGAAAAENLYRGAEQDTGDRRVTRL